MLEFVRVRDELEIDVFGSGLLGLPYLLRRKKRSA
jgi:hypothetical protein